MSFFAHSHLFFPPFLPFSTISSSPSATIAPFSTPRSQKVGEGGGELWGGNPPFSSPKVGYVAFTDALLPVCHAYSSPLPPLPPFRPEQHALFDERLPHLSFRALRTSLCAFERSRLSGAPVSLELQEMLRKTETLQVKTGGNHSI